MTRTLTARWVFPAAGPPLEGGLLTIRDDKIEAVERPGTRAADDDLGNVAIIPGLVNPHTHLDLSGARGLIPPTDPDHLTDWLKGVIAYRKTRSPEQVQEDIRTGLAECLRFGTTLIGDIASGGASWDAMVGTAVRGIVFRELIGFHSFDWQDQYFNSHAWLIDHCNTSTCRAAVSPHAPYTVRSALFVFVHDRVSKDRIPTAIHLGESPAEVDLVRHRKGAFIPFLSAFQFDQWDMLIGSFADLVNMPKSCAPKLFIHCNYIPVDTPFHPNHSVVYCPRTHAAFGHPPHPFREFLKRGVRVCFGTDSLASNPDLDILAEARFVHAKYPDFPGEQLLKMVTLAGAEALGWADECGSLEPGKSADLVAVPLPDRDGDPYELLFSGELATAPRRTMFRGEWRL
jgi:cytosine/adenosine deaminase-related metal-dependent hydrolase